MSSISLGATEGAPAIPVRAIALLALAILLMYLVTFEAGPVSGLLGQGATFLHEGFHDGRHLLGVPCH